MVTTDPIADMLTRIRNANDAYHDKVDMPASKMKAAVLAILKDEGFVKSVEQIEVEGHPELRVALKYGTAEGTRRTWYRYYFHIQGRYDRQSSS